MESDPRKSLLHRAGRLLQRRAYSRFELAERLSELAESSQVDQVLDDLEELGLLNDAEYAYNFAANRFARLGWGPLKVREALLQKRVSPDLIDGAIARCSRGEACDSTLEAYLDRRFRKTGWPSEKRSVHRLILHLRRRGFSDEAIGRTLRSKLPEALWRYVEPGE